MICYDKARQFSNHSSIPSSTGKPPAEITPPKFPPIEPSHHLLFPLSFLNPLQTFMPLDHQHSLPFPRIQTRHFSYANVLTNNVELQHSFSCPYLFPGDPRFSFNLLLRAPDSVRRYVGWLDPRSLDPFVCYIYFLF